MVARDTSSMTGDPHELRGSVVHVRYHDPNSLYTVMSLKVRGVVEHVIAVGHTREIEEDAEVELTGQWVEHGKHGRQFAFDTLRQAVPTAPAAIVRRLLLYPGIGKVTAERIVRWFGADTIRVLEEQPQRLLEVQGVGAKALARIVEHHKLRNGPQARIEDLLVGYGIPGRFASAIMRAFGDDAERFVRERPYQLAKYIKGIGFLTADRLARAMGIAVDDPERMEAGTLHVLELARNEGHVCLPRDVLLERAMRLLRCSAAPLHTAIGSLVASDELRLERGTSQRAHAPRPDEGDAELAPDAIDASTLCYLQALWTAEQGLAASLTSLALASRERWQVGEMPAELSAGQKKAVDAIARHGIAILTGGPGTGKSTVVRHVLELARAHECEVLLAAPTGRAAKRLEQATGHPASTIHRLLEIDGKSGAFQRHFNNPLPQGLLVVDEASMLDVELADALFAAMVPEHRVLIVGDADQLPSVGPGNVLRDLLTVSRRPDAPIPVVVLDQIFRQAEGSSIIVNAHRVLQGQELVSDPPGAIGQFFVMRSSGDLKTRDAVLKMVTQRIPEAYGLDPRNDIQVLCPMHKSAAGTHALNDALQDYYGRGEPALTLREQAGGSTPHRLIVDDRVMQTKNDYDRGLFNGDIGRVRAIDEEAETALIEFDGRVHDLDAKALSAVRLAYAVTIHKSQGSEFPAVVIPLLGEFEVMLRRNLLYTAITRAQRLCVLVGESPAIARAIRRSDAARRFTNLADTLSAQIDRALGGATLVIDEAP